MIRQLLVESVMLSLLGGILGIPLAYAGIRTFDSLTQNVGKPYWMEFSIDPTVLLFFFAICFVTGIVFGLAPALHVSRTSLNEVLKEGGRSGLERDQGAPLDERAARRAGRAHAGAAGGRRVHDAELLRALSPRPRLRDPARSHHADQPERSEVPDRKGAECLRPPT